MAAPDFLLIGTIMKSPRDAVDSTDFAFQNLKNLSDQKYKREYKFIYSIPVLILPRRKLRKNCN